MIVGLLGILKARGAFVPLDPGLPQERLAFMLKDTGAPVVLTHQRLVERLPPTAAHLVCLDADWAQIAQEPAGNPDGGPNPDHMAYIIYTSGTTGIPKGVMIQQGSLAHYTETAAAAIELGPGDRALKFASIAFDTTMEEIFPCLIRGATLVLRTDAMLETMTGFLQTCRDWELTVLDLPTAYWHELTAQLAAESLALPSSVRLVIIGGERALRERLVMWHQQVGPHVRLVNTYGPTEVTVVATLCALSTQTGAALPQEVSIGGPLPGVQVYLLDRDRQPVPVGVVGEMYIGGMGVARGYLNRPELTAEKFLPDPFSNRRGARLYRTGDLARYQSDGRLVFLGRTDDQVKIRGYRFELGEIEAALGQHPAVHNAVVLAREDTPGDKRLVAYIIPTLGMSPTSSDLRRFLEAKLPAYMVPSAFVLLDSLPLTPNGKVDRRTLPAPEQARSEFEATFVAPHTSMEWLVAGVWQEVLRVERVSVYDNFFDIGGHSLTSIQVIARLAKRLGVRLSPRDLMVQTLGQLASTCEARLSLSQPPKAPSVTLRVWRAMKNMVWGRREERS